MLIEYSVNVLVSSLRVCISDVSLTLVYDLFKRLPLNSVSLLQLLYDMSLPQALDSASRHLLHTQRQVNSVRDSKAVHFSSEPVS